jgi:formylmethanofuran dehydrogenase subunit E
VEDCALIVASHTLVGRALLETSDLFKAAIRCLKQENENAGSVSIHNETISKMRQLRKKLEFFLSWSQYAKSEFGSTIEDEMMQWRHHWNADLVAADQLSDVFDDLLLQDPVVNMASIERSPKSPLIVEMPSM